MVCNVSAVDFQGERGVDEKSGVREEECKLSYAAFGGLHQE